MTTAAAQPESSVTPYAPSPSTTAHQTPQLANRKPRTNCAQRRKLHDDETRVEEGGRLKNAVPEEIVGMSHGTEKRDRHHTSHVTRHTIHVTRHRSNVKSHTSNVTRHTSSHVTRHTSHVKSHTLHVTRCKRNVRANPSPRTCAASSAAVVVAAAAAADAGSLLLQTQLRATSKAIEFAAAAAAANCPFRDQRAPLHGLNKPAAAAHVIVTRDHEAQCTCRLEACKTERRRRRRCCACCRRRLQRKT